MKLGKKNKWKNFVEGKMDKIKEIEKENVALRGCIDSALMTLADYDGYREAEDLMRLIDDVVGTLRSGYPDRMVDFEGKESCPLCFQRLKKDLSSKFELVQVHENENCAEVVVRDKNSFKVYAGNLDVDNNPKGYYPPDCSIKAEMDFSEDWYELTEEERQQYAEEQNKEYDEYVKWYSNLTPEELEKQNEELREFRYRHDI